MNRREALRRWGKAGLGFAALALVGPVSLPARPALAAGPCEERPAAGAAVVAGPPDGRAESLARPFQAKAWPSDRVELLSDARRRVVAALSAIDAPACYAGLLPSIAGRTAFLSPFEFLVVGYYGWDAARRDALLRLYREDPHLAVRRLSGIWPSPRAERLIATRAYFDLEANQIYLNLGAVAPDQAQNVLVHEFWHALADVRPGRRPDGALTRTTGFWTEARPAHVETWRPVEETIAGGVPTYLMNEAVAIEMEVAATGRQHPSMRPDLVAALGALHELFAAAGRARVLQLYLASRSDELLAISG